MWNEKFPYSPDEVRRNPSCLRSGAPMINRQHATIVPWNPPTRNTLKWNVDASRIEGKANTGLEGVLRDNSGNIWCIFSCSEQDIPIYEAELQAIEKALDITVEKNEEFFKNIEVESDSKIVVGWCNKENLGPWSCSNILNKIWALRTKWRNLSFKFRKGESNQLADSLAKKAVDRESDFLAWV